MFITKRKIVIFLYSLFFAIPGLIDAANTNDKDLTNTAESKNEQIANINEQQTQPLKSHAKSLEDYRKESEEWNKNYEERNKAVNQAINESLQKCEKALDSLQASLNAPEKISFGELFEIIAHSVGIGIISLVIIYVAVTFVLKLLFSKKRKAISRKRVPAAIQFKITSNQS